MVYGDTIDDARHGAETLVGPLDGWIISQIGSHGGRDDVVGTTHQATHKGQKHEQDSHGDLVHVFCEYVSVDRQEKAYRKGIDISEAKFDGNIC